jgi:signal transduction histidine kinase
MTYRVLQLHNGSLDFVTEMGRGTTFRLILPLAGTTQQEKAEIVTQT